jgi:Domain of unknown function (DUF4412)
MGVVVFPRPERCRMSRFIALGTLTLVVTAGELATADTRIVSEERTRVTMGDKASDETTTTTLWIGHDRAARITPSGRMISRPDRGESYIVDDAKKSYVVIAMKPDGAGASTKAKIGQSGERRQIGPWSAVRHDPDFEYAPGETGHAVLWISSDVDLDLERYRAFARSMGKAMGMGWLESVAALDGYPVLQEATVAGVQVTTRLVSAAEETPPPDLYEPPAGYTRSR